MPLEAAFAHLFACLIQTNPQRFFGRIVYPPKEGMRPDKRGLFHQFCENCKRKNVILSPFRGRERGGHKNSEDLDTYSSFSVDILILRKDYIAIFIHTQKGSFVGAHCMRPDR